MRLLIGSHNDGKIIEIGHALEGLPLELTNAKQLELDEPVEDGGTYRENARIKAEFYSNETGLPAMADDSGIVVEALRGELGVDTRHWGAGSEATDEEWIAAFLARMENETNRKARFVCTIAFHAPGKQTEYFEGFCDGEIARSVEAPYLPRLPISGCFRPEGYAAVYSALTPDEKNAVSHRGKALQLFRRRLEHMLNA